jgi:hypothetical protein
MEAYSPFSIIDPIDQPTDWHRFFVCVCALGRSVPIFLLRYGGWPGLLTLIWGVGAEPCTVCDRAPAGVTRDLHLPPSTGRDASVRWPRSKRRCSSSSASGEGDPWPVLAIAPVCAYFSFNPVG